VSGTAQLVPYDKRPTAITGTWSDIERTAEYVYLTAEKDSNEFELAEAVLVLVTPR